MNVFQKIALGILEFTARVYWWGICLATPLLLFGAIYFARQSDEFRVRVPVKFPRGSVKVPGFEYEKVHKLIMTNTGEMVLRFEPTWQNKMITILLFAAGFTAMAVVVYQVKKILKSLMRNKPFDKMNFYRVRIIAYMLIGFFIAEIITFLIMEYTIFSSKNYQAINFSYTAHIVLFWTGLIMLVLEAVFKRGAYLEEEELLTI